MCKTAKSEKGKECTRYIYRCQTMCDSKYGEYKDLLFNEPKNSRIDKKRKMNVLLQKRRCALVLTPPLFEYLRLPPDRQATAVPGREFLRIRLLRGCPPYRLLAYFRCRFRPWCWRLPLSAQALRVCNARFPYSRSR